MNPPQEQQNEVALSDGEMARLQAYADHHGLSIENALNKASQDALIHRVLPNKRTAPATVAAFTRRLRALS